MPRYNNVWRGALLFLAVSLLLYAGYFTFHAYSLARSRGELNYAESTWLFAALRIRDGLTPYFDLTGPPYIPMVYTPLLPGLSGSIGNLLGLSNEQVITLTRLFSLISALAISALIALMCRLLGARPMQAIIAGLLFLTPTVTFTLWSIAARSDMLAVAIGLGAITLLMTTSKQAMIGLWSVALSGLLCGLALAAKQTAVAPLVAIWLWLAFGMGAIGWRRRTAHLSLFTLSAVVGLVLTLLPFGTQGAAILFQGTLDLSTQPQSSADFYTRLDNLATMFGWCFPLSALGLWSLLQKPDNFDVAGLPERTARLVLLYFVVATIVFLASAGKLGSASSYCLELIALLCVAAGRGLSQIDRLISRIEPAMAPILILLAVVPVGTQAWYAIKTAQLTRELGPNDQALAALARVGSGPVLSENGYILLESSAPPYLLDPLYFSVQQHAGEWHSAPTIEMAKQRKFVSVVLFHALEARPSVNGIEWLPAGLYDAIAENYSLAGVQGRYYVYVPDER